MPLNYWGDFRDGGGEERNQEDRSLCSGDTTKERGSFTCPKEEKANLPAVALNEISHPGVGGRGPEKRYNCRKKKGPIPRSLTIGLISDEGG